MSRWLGLGLILAAVGALALRLPQLERRPMHNDEAVNALKLQGLWERGDYRYDPEEYHGPSLYYFSLPFVWLSGARDFDQLRERTLRLTPVFFGVVLILLLWLLRDGLGRAATFCAAVLTALSPAMVFYSRYFIHEMLLVCFTMLFLAAAWRYVRSHKLSWAIAAGVGLGLMYATKETFVIPLGATALATGLTCAWAKWQDKAPIDWQACCKPWPLLAALAAAILVSQLLFSSFLTNPRGPLDSLRTYLPWLHRAGGHSPHVHSWSFYLERLAWFHQDKGPVWSEALILALAAAGGVAAFTRRGTVGMGEAPATQPRTGTSPSSFPLTPTLSPGEREYQSPRGAKTEPPRPCPTPEAAFPLPQGEGQGDGEHSAQAREARPSNTGPHSAFLRFLACYTLILTAAYSLIAYKTPWCMLGFLHGMILLAGVGAVALLQLFKSRTARGILALMLALGVAQLGRQAWRASYAYAADRRNPYVYAQTVPNALELVQWVNAIARNSPAGHQTLLKIVAPESDYWPLPWYLRHFKRVGWYDQSPADPYAPMMIISSRLHAELDEKSDKRWLMVRLFEFRPGVFFELYVQFDLWKKYVDTRPRPKDE